MSSIPTRAQATGGAAVRAAGWVAPLCWIAVLLDGFDLVVVGTVVPTLSQPGEFALIGAVASFSLFTLLCAFAPNEVVFGILRLLAGLGLGGCLPTAIAMVNEFSRSGRSGRATTTVMTGYHVGAVTTAALAIVVIPDLGWRWMFVIGGVPG